MTPARPLPDLRDPRWLPVDLHVPDRRFQLLRLDEDVIERSAFLDTRIEAALAEAVPVPVGEVAAAPPVGPPMRSIGWLFHTSFCGSTLLARALHVRPHAVCLREPLVLRRLSDAARTQWAIDDLIAPTVQLLARPWHPGGAVVIKPTHVALNIAGALLAQAPGSRAVVLTCSLAEFLISNLKKPPDSQAKIPVLVDRMLGATRFASRLSAAARTPPDVVAAAALQWAATRELMLDVIEAAGPDRIRALDMQPLLDDLPGTAWACARWLGLAVPRDRLAAHAAEVGTHNAKAYAVPFDVAQRSREAASVAEHYRDPLARAIGWADRHVLPAMRPAARAQPAAWA